MVAPETIFCIPFADDMRVAVVGSGVSGLGATWHLNEHSPHEVHLYESDQRPGGHANTVDIRKLDGTPGTVDTGFIVFNHVTYPTFKRFLETVGIEYMDSEMSFSVSHEQGQFEWAGGSLSALFGQHINVINPRHWRMIWDILRFNAEALDSVGEPGSIGDYLSRKGYGQGFIENYLLPMTAAIWSTPADTASLDFPLSTLLRFMHNHHLLQIFDQPQWLTVKGGSRKYVERIVSRLPEKQYHLGEAVQSVRTNSSGKVIILTNKGEQAYDHVIMATHADTTLRLLKAGGGVTDDEKDILGAFGFEKNRAVLHSDKRLMPVRRSTWSAWNYLTTENKHGAVEEMSLTYCMNRLQSLDEKEYGPVLVTMNPPFEPQPSSVVAEFEYEHPLFSAKSVAAQRRLDEIQGKRGISYAGAWTNYGFHEDGFYSGLYASSRLYETPFSISKAIRPLPSGPRHKLAVQTFQTAESARRALERPFEYFALGATLCTLGVERAARIADGVLSKVGAGQSMKSLAATVKQARVLWEPAYYKKRE